MTKPSVSWERAGDHARRPLIAVSFGGVYSPDGAGVEFAHAMIESLRSALAETRAAGVVLDLTALDYVWGDTICGLAMPLFDKGKGFRPAAIVAAGRTAKALEPLLEPNVLLGVAGMKLVRTREEALAHLERALDVAPDDSQMEQTLMAASGDGDAASMCVAAVAAQLNSMSLGRQGILRRLAGILIGAVPPLIVVWSFVDGSRLFDGRYVALGYCIFALGAIVCSTNFYLSVLRGPLIQLRTGTPPLSHISGIPFFGAIMFAGLALLPRSVALSCGAALLVLCDTGGVSWFVVATWRDRSFWNS